MLGGVTEGCQDRHPLGSLTRYQVVSTWIDYQQAGEPSQYITITKVSLVFHLLVVGKSSTGLSGCG